MGRSSGGEAARLAAHRPPPGVPCEGVSPDERRPAEVDEEHCAACEVELREPSAGPVCERCDRQLDKELAAYLSFVAVCRE